MQYSITLLDGGGPGSHPLAPAQDWQAGGMANTAAPCQSGITDMKYVDKFTRTEQLSFPN